jgi:HEPN domain-containing protein
MKSSNNDARARENVTTQAATPEMTPEILANNLLDHAKEFRAAARSLAKSKPFIFHPTFYCAIHSVELAIKAHLALAGLSKKMLSSKALGHNLAALLKEAERQNIQDALLLDSHESKNISLGSRAYSGKCFEYPEILYSTFPIDIWLDWADRVIVGFEKKLSK